LDSEELSAVANVKIEILQGNENPVSILESDKSSFEIGESVEGTSKN
jgi:hypothetical protein